MCPLGLGTSGDDLQPPSESGTMHNSGNLLFPSSEGQPANKNVLEVPSSPPIAEPNTENPPRAPQATATRPKIEIPSDEESEEDSEEDMETDDEMFIQEVRDTSRSLNLLLNHIRKTYPLLQCDQHISDSGIDFIDITRRYLSGSTLPFFQAFHLIILPSIEPGTFFAQMMSYHGKLLQKETIHFNEDQDAIDSKLLIKFNTGIFRLCRGLKQVKISKLDPSKVLIEYLNELISVRSRQCEFAIFGILVDKNVTYCAACQALAAKLTKAQKSDFSDSDGDDDSMAENVEQSEGDEETENREEDFKNNAKNGVSRIKQDVEASDEDEKPLGKKFKPKKSVVKRTEVIDVSNLAEIKRKRKYTSANEEQPAAKVKNGQKNLQYLIDLGIINVEKVSPAEAARKKEELASLRGKEATSASGENKKKGNTNKKKRRSLPPDVKPKILLKTPEELANMKGKTGKKKRKIAAQLAMMNAKQLPEGIKINPIRKPARIVNPNAVPARKVKEDPDQPRVMQTCQVCLFKHDRGYIFDKHVETHEQRYNLNTPVTCPVCQVEFPTKYELNPHFQVEHNREQGCCVECLMVCDAKALRRHLEYSHYINLKNKLCSHCGKAFKSRQDLEIHIAVAHGKNVQNVICDICGKVLPHPKMLGKHIQSAHVYNNKGKHKCPFCDKVFDKTISWHKHLKVHSRVKPYRCGFCDYRSIKRYNILLHMRKRHKENATYDDLVKDGEFDYGVPMEDIEMEKYLVPEDSVFILK